MLVQLVNCLNRVPARKRRGAILLTCIFWSNSHSPPPYEQSFLFGLSSYRKWHGPGERHSELAGLSRAKQFGRFAHGQASRKDRSRRKAALEDRRAVVAVFAVRIGQQDFSYDISRG